MKRQLRLAAGAALPILVLATAAAAQPEWGPPICEMDENDFYPEDPAMILPSNGKLYTSGLNVPSGPHRTYGSQTADAITPLDEFGDPDLHDGKIGFVSIGLSNTTQIWSAFERDVYDDPSFDLRPGLVLLSLAQGGLDLEDWNDVTDDVDGQYDTAWVETVEDRLAVAGLHANQVQVIHLYVIPQFWENICDPGDPCTTFVEQQTGFADQLEELIELEIFPRFEFLQQVYISSREPGNWASIPDPTTHGQGEPITYESGFGMKEVVDRFVTKIEAPGYDDPWVGWGPYVWADADNLRLCSDLTYEPAAGVQYECLDSERCTSGGNTHPSVQGEAKIANLYRRFYSRDPIAKRWFLRDAADPPQSGNIVLEPMVDGRYEGEAPNGTAFWNEGIAATSSNELVDKIFIKFPLQLTPGTPILDDPDLVRHATFSIRVAPCDQQYPPGNCDPSGGGKRTQLFYSDPVFPGQISMGTLPGDRQGGVGRPILRASRGTAMSWDVTADVVDALTLGEAHISFRLDRFRQMVLSEFLDVASGDADPPRLFIHWREPPSP